MTEKLEQEYSAKEYIEDLYKIKDKEGNLVPLVFNTAQNTLYDKLKESYNKKPTRIIVLKSRQMGVSTFFEAFICFLTSNVPYTNAVIEAHLADSATNIFGMTKLFINQLPNGLRPSEKYSNAREIVFDNDEGTGLKSSIRVMVASDATRGSTYKLAHLSEVAFWEHPKEAMSALNQAVPNTNDSLIVIESTANGFNYFYDLWQDSVNGRNDYIPIFFPWFIEPHYSMPYKGFELTPYEKDIKERYNLTNDQLQWRRWCIANNCSNDELVFRQEYPISPEEAFITSGENVFNTEIILERMKDLPTPIRTGYFTYEYNGLTIKNIHWNEDSQGYIKIYQDYKGGNYVLGGDTAGEGEDFFVGQVLAPDGSQVAVLHKKFDEDLYTKQIYCLGLYYHALVAIEVNFSTYPNQELQRLGYPYLYVREKYDRIRPGNLEKFGFRTTSQTRPLIISQLVEIVREDIDKIVDRETLQEMLSFVYIKGKPQASEGTHDDLVMALAIAYEAYKQVPHRGIFKNQRREKERSSDMEFFEFGS